MILWKSCCKQQCHPEYQAPANPPALLSFCWARTISLKPFNKIIFLKKRLLSLLCWSCYVFICLKGIQEHFFGHQCQTIFCLQMGWMLAVLWVLPQGWQGNWVSLSLHNCCCARGPVALQQMQMPKSHLARETWALWWQPFRCSEFGSWGVLQVWPKWEVGRWEMAKTPLLMCWDTHGVPIPLSCAGIALEKGLLRWMLDSPQMQPIFPQSHPDLPIFGFRALGIWPCAWQCTGSYSPPALAAASACVKLYFLAVEMHRGCVSPLLSYMLAVPIFSITVEK